MSTLSPEREKARELTRAIGALDRVHAWVTSPPGEPRVRIQIAPCCKPRVLSKLTYEMNWRPQFVGLEHRTSELGFSGMIVECYEVDVAKQLISGPPTDPREIPK